MSERQHFLALALILGSFLLGKESSAGEPTQLPLGFRIETAMHSSAITALAAAPMSALIFSGSEDGTIRVWDAGRQRHASVYYLPESQTRIRLLSTDLRGENVAIASDAPPDHGRVSTSHSTVLLLRRSLGGQLRSLDAKLPALQSLALSGDGKYLWVISQGQMTLFDTQSLKKLAQVDDCPRPFAACAGATGQLIVACGDHSLRTYQPSIPIKGPSLRVDISEGASSLALTLEGSRLALGYEGVPRVEVRSTSDLSLVFSPDVSGVASGDLRHVVWSESGAVLAAWGSARHDRGVLVRRWAGGGQGAFIDAAVAGGAQAAVALPAARRTELPLLGARDAVVVGGAPADSVLLGTRSPSLIAVPPNGQPLAWADSRLPEMAGTQMLLDYTGSTIELGANGSKDRILFSVQESTLRKVTRADPRLHPPRQIVPGLTLEHRIDAGLLLINGQPGPLPNTERVAAAAAAPSGTGVVAAIRDQLIFLRAGRQIAWRQTGAGEIVAVNVSGDSRVVVSAHADGRVCWRSLADGRLLLSLWSARDHESWIAWTPMGYYTSSARGDDFLAALLPPGSRGLAEGFRIARMQEQLHQPDVIKLVLATLDDQAAAAEVLGGQHALRLAQSLPPVVVLESPEQEAAVSSPRLMLRVRVRSAGSLPILALHATVRTKNGQTSRFTVESPKPSAAAAGQDRPEPAEFSYDITVPVPAAHCTVYVHADTQLATSEPAELRLRWVGPPSSVTPPKPKLFVLAVGVGNYKNPSLRLTYPAKDARDLRSLLEKQKDRLYSEVNASVLTDQEATRDRIRERLAWFRSAATKDDISILLLAGHGISHHQTGRYYFFPHEADMGDPENTLLSEVELRKAVNGMEGKVLLLLDTCHAGGAIDQRSALKEGDLLRLVNQVARAESGVIVFSASTRAQAAAEDPKWKNGVFTKALVEGLGGRADAAGSGLVTLSSLEAYVTDRVRSLTNQAQEPAINTLSAIVDFPLTKVPKPVYRQAWFWGVLGLGAAAVVVGGVVGAAPWRQPLPRLTFMPSN